MTPLTPETLAELERLLADITPGRDKPFVRLTMRNWSTICNAAPALICAARSEQRLRNEVRELERRQRHFAICALRVANMLGGQCGCNSVANPCPVCRLRNGVSNMLRIDIGQKQIDATIDGLQADEARALGEQP